MDEVEDLVVTPFREIVEKAKRAVDNAGDSNPEMLKASKTLLKEGERGLKRIEPLCRKYIDDYGSSFVASLKENDEIASYRSELTDLLWEFDDYIEPDDFEAEKFAELQGLSRKAAPKIYDILMRMKLEAPVSDAASSRGSVSQLMTPTSPPEHLASLSGVAIHRASATSSLADVHDANSQLRGMMRSPSVNGHEQPKEPPRPPSMNPWDWQARPGMPPAPAGSDPRTPDEIEFDRRIADNESPILPTSSLSADPPVSAVRPPANVASPTSDPGMNEDNRRNSHMSEHTSYDRTGYNNPYYFIPGRPRNGPFTPYSIPENSVSQHEMSPSRQRHPSVLPHHPIPEHEIQHSAIPFFQTTTAPYSPTHSQHSAHAPYPLSPGSDLATDVQQNLDLTTVPSHETRPRELSTTSAVSPLQMPPPLPPSLPPQPAVDAASADVLANMDAGPIPVDSEKPKSGLKPFSSPEVCQIGDDSSFQLGKGFCEGARDVVRGGIGVKRTKKQGFVAQSTVARCLGCLYELDFQDIERDVNREDKGTSSKPVGISYRVRFLQKSHLAAKRVDDVQYACVFCIRLGHTIDKSDATVFFTQKQLFDHLARHTRPLPEVPGVTVIETEEVPEKYRNDFDIHFRKPPKPHPVIERADEIVNQPCGIAKEQARRLYGQRLLYDRSPALELAQGARILGITWPAVYQGEWIFGWHDGVYASIPSDLVRLEQPPGNELRYDRTSMTKCKARWKFSIKEKDKDKQGDWLKFDKNETITNIAFINSEHWCWSGVNSKGKSGIFPQAFLDTNTLSEPIGTTSARQGSLQEEKARSSASMLSKFSMRKSSATGRPPSIAGSTISH